MNGSHHLSRPLLFTVFHRHGMRAPIGNPLGVETDRQTWLEELPEPSTLSAMQQQYPTLVHTDNPIPFDLKTHPYGCLTRLGVQHLEEVGAQVRARFPALSSLNSQPADKLKVWSTNYQRTQASAQSFLKGLGVAEGTPIEVKAFTDCAMSFYHGKRSLATSLSRRIKAQPPFQALEQQVAPAALALRLACPDMDPSVDVNWILVADHLNCQLAHQHAGPHPSIQPHSELVRDNAVQRFVAHYKDREFLAHFAGPLLLDVLLEIESVVNATLLNDNNNISCSGDDAASDPVGDEYSSARPSCPQVTIFSGHDVNILGMLFALNAVLDDAHWPSYGSTLSFEVVECTPSQEQHCDASHPPLPPDQDQARAALLSRLRINFYYGCGVSGEPIEPLVMHTDRRVFDKCGGGFTSSDEVTALLAREKEGDGESVGVATSMSYHAFEKLHRELLGAGVGAEKEA